MPTQVDPLQSITLALRSLFAPLDVPNVTLGFPDSKELNADGYLPAVGILSVSDDSTHKTGREKIHAVQLSVDGLTATYYKELLRTTYLLQVSLFTKTVEDRSNIGWSIQQTLEKTKRLAIGTLGNDKDGNPIETAMFKYRHQRDDLGEPGFYQRDITFEVTVRMLDVNTAPTMKTLTVNQNQM